MSESVNPYLDPRAPRAAYLTSPAGPVDTEVTGAGVEVEVSADLPEAAREAVRALGPAPRRPQGLTAVEDPVLLEDGSLSVQLHPGWDGPSTETAVTLTAPGDGGPVTVRAGGPATQDLLTGRATPQDLGEDAWLTGVPPDLAAQPDPTRLSDTQAAALALGAPQASVYQALDTLAVGLEAVRLDAGDATQGARPAATTRFRDRQARAVAARALADSLVLGVDGHNPAAVAAQAAQEVEQARGALAEAQDRLRGVVIAAVTADGAGVTDTARQAGVDRTTVYPWLGTTS